MKKYIIKYLQYSMEVFLTVIIPIVIVYLSNTQSNIDIVKYVTVWFAFLCFRYNAIRSEVREQRRLAIQTLLTNIQSDKINNITKVVNVFKYAGDATSPTQIIGCRVCFTRVDPGETTSLHTDRYAEVAIKYPWSVFDMLFFNYTLPTLVSKTVQCKVLNPIIMGLSGTTMGEYTPVEVARNTLDLT